MKKRKLKKLLKALLLQLAATSHTSTHSARPLNDWIDIHEQQLRERGYHEQTIKNRMANLAHARRLWGAVDIGDLRPHRVLSDLREAFMPVRLSTARRVLAELRDAYTNAIANDWAESNPALHVKLPAQKIKRRRLTLEIWQQMMDRAGSSSIRWLEPMLLLALVTGQRRADLAKMAFTDVVDDCLRVEQQKQAGKGYGARVAIPLKLRLQAIDLSVGDVIERCRSYARPGSTLLRRRGGGDIELSSLSTRFNECIRAACGPSAFGLREWPSLHEVRSLAARLYRAEGVDVQTLLGHKDAEMTAVYVDDRGLSAHEWKRVPLGA